MVRGNDYTGPRPHVQGSAAALRVRGGGGRITDAGGLVVVRKLWDALGLGGWIDRRSGNVPGRYRPSLMVESWVVLLLYGGGVMDDPPLLERRGVRRILGWARVPHPATFGRWLRGSAAVLSPLLDELLWRMARRRWELAGGAPRSATIVMDSTVVVRYGLKQAGAERGYNPKKPGRPSHHPLLAYVLETGDCLGVRWRPGGAHTARGAEAWLAELVARLRGAGVRRITVRLDKGFFSKSIARRMEELGVSYLLKVPRHRLARRLPGRLGDRRPGRGRGPGAEDGLRRAVGDAASLGREAETGRAGRGRTRSRGVGDHDERRRSDQHREHRPRRGVARLQRGRGRRAADRGVGPALGRPHRGGRPRRQRPAVEPRRARPPTPPHPARELPRRPLARRAAARHPAAPAARPRQDNLPRPPNLARVRARRPGPRPPAAGAPNHRHGARAARTRLTGPGPGLPKAPRGGAHSPCLREPFGTPPEPRRPSAEARSGPENATARAKSPQPPVIIALRPPDYPPTQDPGSTLLWSK